MNALRQVLGRSLWVGVGGAALLVAGCATARVPVTLTGAAQVPPVTTTATGTTDITVNGYKSIFGTVTTSGVVGTAAHIHMGAVGKTGGVVIPLVKKDANTWVLPSNASLSDAQLYAYNTGELYVNVHSDANKGGEIRGQLKP
jgi:hypothetical protein